MSKVKSYDILDLAKFILSIMIVAIHTALFQNYLFPWLRIAVPLFFMISSFLLFKRVNATANNEKDKVIKKYIIRQLKLYLFWFIILLPLTIYYRKDWVIGVNNIFQIITNILSNTLFSSTFIASWFIVASIWATIIVYNASKKINNKILFVIFLLINIICCLISSYNMFYANNEFISKVVQTYTNFFSSPVFSFPVALFWIFMGKMFADEKINYKIKYKKTFCLILIVFILLLYMEWKYVYSLSGMFSNDCYLFLRPICVMIFKLLLNININLKHNKILRNISTITFPLHASVAPVVAYILKHFITDYTIVGIFNFIITLSGCLLASFIILKLEDKKYFKFLKYAH